MRKYTVKEIFYSIQGEGRWAGYACVFVRFCGCNLRCPWCDTDFNAMTGAMVLTADEVVAKVEEARLEFVSPDHKLYRKFVVLTGGEPMLQITASLLKKLHRLGYSIHVETNGTCLQREHGIYGLIDWLTVSPKAGHPVRIRADADEVKVVWPQEGLDLEKIRKQHHFSLQYGMPYLFLQPNSMDFGPAIEYVKHNPQWRLSVQLQKILRVR